MKFKIISGPKGLKIVLGHNPENLTTTSLILVNVGTDWETPSINGIAHFIEHLYFKGTKNFPNPKILLENIDKIGGKWNAFTGHEYTGFYLKVLPEYTKDALFILSDIILNPLFPEEEIEKERKVIFEEINLYQDQPARLVIDLGFQTAFGHQPAGFSILGTKETISKIKRAHIIKYVRDHYSAKNTLVVLGGRIEKEKELISFIAEKFKNYRSQKPPSKKPTKLINEYRENIHPKKVEQAHLFLGFTLPGFKVLQDKRYILSLISVILGEMASSRLFFKIREELGAAYYIKSDFIEYTDRSLIFVHAGLNLEKLSLVLKELIEEIKKLKKEGLTESELDTAKATLKSSLFMELEESLGLARFLGAQYLLEKKIKTPAEIMKKINSIKKEDLHRELKNLFTFKQAKLALIVPPEVKFDVTEILKKLD